VPPSNNLLDTFNYDFGQTLITENQGFASTILTKKNQAERASNFSSNSLVLTDFNRRSIFKDGTLEQNLSFRNRILS